MISRLPARSLYSTRVIRSHVARPDRAGTTARAEPKSGSDKPKKPEPVEPVVEPVVEAKAETIDEVVVDEVTPEPAVPPTPAIYVEDVRALPLVRGRVRW